MTGHRTVVIAAVTVATILMVPAGGARAAAGAWEPAGPGAWDGARTIDDGHGLLIDFIGGRAGTEPCAVDYRAIVDETAREVRVAIQGKLVVPDAGAGAPLVGCNDVGYERQLRVALDRRLGDRTVVDVNANAVRPVFDGNTLARPGYIPSTWKLVSEGSALHDEHEPSWQRTWLPPRPEPADARCTPHETGVMLMQATRASGDELARRIDLGGPYAVASRHRVGRGPAEYRASSDTAVLSWTIDGAPVVMWSLAECAGDRPPPLEAMLRIARSIPA